MKLQISIVTFLKITQDQSSKQLFQNDSYSETVTIYRMYAQGRYSELLLKCGSSI